MKHNNFVFTNKKVTMDLKCQWYMISLPQLGSLNGSRDNCKFVKIIWMKKLSGWNKKSQKIIFDFWRLWPVWYSMSANWRGKIGVLVISCKERCPLIRGSANWVSAFWKLFYEDLTRKRPGKIKLSANQRCPPFRVSVN